MFERPLPDTITDVWYHANCPDGFASALAAWLVLGDKISYQPVSYGEQHPVVSSKSRVVIVDFTYPREILLAIEAKVDRLMVLDHHYSAERELGGLDFAHFDMSKSGCRLAWEFWHPKQALPELFAYIEDRDLWNWALPESREVSLALAQYPMEFELWSRLEVAELKRAGKFLVDFQNSLIERALIRTHWLELGGHRVPVCNSCLFQSEIGDALCLKYPQASFAGVYYSKGESIAWSLRSIGDFDVSQVAAGFGGGGHRNAAGFGAGLGGPLDPLSSNFKGVGDLFAGQGAGTPSKIARL